MRTLFKNAKIVLCDEVVFGDLLTENGYIVEIGEDILNEAENIVDCENKYILPGLIDTDCTVTDPGFDYKENIYTLTKAALHGGFTTIIAQPNTNPFIESKMAVEYVKNKFRDESILDIRIAGSLTKNEILEEEIAEIYEMKRAGICALSDGNRSIMNVTLLNEILKYCELVDLPVMLSSIQRELVGERFIIEGPTAAQIGVQSIPRQAQDIAVATNIILARDKKVKVHLSNLTSKTALEIYSDARKRNQNLTCGISAHYLAFTESELETFNSVYKIRPCLRNESDRLAVIESVKNGMIDCITSGHRPETKESKEMHLSHASYGVSSIETTFLLAYNTLVIENQLDMPDFVRLFTKNPASIFKITKKGEIKVGNIADLVVFDAEDFIKVEASSFYSKAKYSMLEGKGLKGRIKSVYISGNEVFSDKQ